MSEQINIDAIMEEIRTEAEKHRGKEQLPDFDPEALTQAQTCDGADHADEPGDQNLPG